MSKSLQDQLLGAGLVDKKKAKSISKQKKKQKNIDRRSKEETVSEAQKLAQQARQEKLEKDRALNEQQRQAAERKAIAAQIIQLIEMNRIDRQGGEVEYNFTDGKTIKKLLVTPILSEQLSRGRLCIARLGENYELVPKPVAEKIRERDMDAIVVFNETTEANSETDDDADYYAQFEIPDDLMW